MSGEEVKEEDKQAIIVAKEFGEPVPVKVMTTSHARRVHFMEGVVNASGIIVGYGLGMVANLVSKFTSGFELGMISSGQRAKEDMQESQAPLQSRWKVEMNGIKVITQNFVKKA